MISPSARSTADHQRWLNKSVTEVQHVPTPVAEERRTSVVDLGLTHIARIVATLPETTKTVEL